MFYKRVKKCETKYITWLKDNLIKRDIIITLASSKRVLIKIKEESEIENELITNEDLEVEVESLKKKVETTRK